MESSEIVGFINVFNTVAVFAAAFFAVLGIFVIIRKPFKPNVFRRGVYIGAFCVAAAGAFALEATVFNFQYYARFFADPGFYTMGASPEDSTVALTSDGTPAELFADRFWGGNPVPMRVDFKDVGRRVTSILINVNFHENETAKADIQWIDENGSRGVVRPLYKRLPHENNVLLQSNGKVSELVVMVSPGGNRGSPVALQSVAINDPIPMYFSGLRLFVVSLLIFALIILARKELRAKASYYLFEYKFDPRNRKQNYVYALTVLLLILFTWISAYTSVIKDEPSWRRQYNQYLVDALIAGRTYLDHGTPERLLDAEYPYDTYWLAANGYERGVDWMWDWAWYEGKFYSYFGVVPAVILYVPYKLATGDYLPYHAGVFLFISVATVLLAALWRFCVIKYMPGARFAFYALSFLALYFTAGFFVTLRYPTFYTIVQAAGYMFSIAGVLLLLKSVENERIRRITLFFACFCLALVVGCRPNLIFASIFVPVVLWKYRSWKLLLFVAMPYIIVAIPLCMYNYARFGSITEFGSYYQLSFFRPVIFELSNPVANAVRAFVSLASYLFVPGRYSLFFPFVEGYGADSWIVSGVFSYREYICGMINFPVVFCLFYLFRNVRLRERPRAFGVAFCFLAVGAAVLSVNALLIGTLGRYMIDFSTFIIFPSLFGACYWCEGSDSAYGPKTRMKAVYVMLGASIFVGLFLFASGLGHTIGADPSLYRYLERSLGVLRHG